MIGQNCSDFPLKNLKYEENSGYYAADLCESAISIRLIAMNSAKMEKWGANANINPAQRSWLKTALLSANEGINLIFAHHRPEEFDPETKALLAASDHAPVVMFTGHTHL